MIRINVEDINKINNWYVDMLLPLILEVEVSCKEKSVLKTSWQSYLEDISICRDILSKPVSDLMAKYKWIDEYVNTILFLYHTKALNSLTKKVKGKDSKKKRQEMRKKYIKTYINENLMELLIQECNKVTTINGGGLEQICFTKKQFDSFVDSTKKVVKRFNDVVSIRFDYQNILGQSKVRAELVKKLDIKICPYCNRQFINSFTDSEYEKTWYLGDIDHILPKSDFPLFSLSFYNLIPVCKVCNQLFKKNKIVNLLNPYFEGFGKDVTLTFRYKTVKEMVGLEPTLNFSWEMADGLDKNKTEKYCNNIRVFHLNDVYKSNAKEFQKIARLKFYSEEKAYKHKLQKYGGIDEKMIYGVSLSEDKFQEELLSKAIYDIVYRN